MTDTNSMSELGRLRWVRRSGKGGWWSNVLQEFIPNILGFDENGCPHYGSGGEWVDVPVVEEDHETKAK